MFFLRWQPWLPSLLELVFHILQKTPTQNAAFFLSASKSRSFSMDGFSRDIMGNCSKLKRDFSRTKMPDRMKLGKAQTLQSPPIISEAIWGGPPKVKRKNWKDSTWARKEIAGKDYAPVLKTRPIFKVQNIKDFLTCLTVALLAGGWTWTMFIIR